MHGERCPICDMGTLKREVVEEPFEYKGHKITIPNYIKYRCNKCGEAVVDNGTLRESGKVLKDFQRQVDGMLTGEEIKRIRTKLNLTQEEMAEIAGGGLKAFARYESGQIGQSRGMDNLLRILDAYPSALQIIQRPLTKKVSQFKGRLIDFQEYKYKVRKKKRSDEYYVRLKGASYGTQV